MSDPEDSTDKTGSAKVSGEQPDGAIDFPRVWTGLSEKDRALLRFLWNQAWATADDSACASVQQEWGFEAWNTATHRLQARGLITRTQIGQDSGYVFGWTLEPSARDLLAWQIDREQRAAPYQVVDDISDQVRGGGGTRSATGTARAPKVNGGIRKGERLFGDWIRTTDRVGSGGQGDLFLGFHRTDSARAKPHVIKQLRNPARIKRFEREVQAALMLDHPGIVKVVASDLEAAKPYLVTPYCSRGELTFAFVSSLEAPERLRLFAGVCRAVGFAHERGVVHRDLKPQNILIADDGAPVIADFGICYINEEDRPTETLEAVGSRFCTPPELEDGRANDVSPASDVYCLGKLLYWMFAGRTFQREKQRDADLDLTKRPPLATHALVYDLLDQLIVTDPSKRLADGNAAAVAAEKHAEVLAGGGHVLLIDLPQECHYCRLGFYEIRVDPRSWSPGADERAPGEGLQRAERVAHLYGLGVRADEPWLVLQCNRCGNIQKFQMFGGAPRFGAAWK